MPKRFQSDSLQKQPAYARVSRLPLPAKRSRSSKDVATQSSSNICGNRESINETTKQGDAEDGNIAAGLLQFWYVSVDFLKQENVLINRIS